MHVNYLLLRSIGLEFVLEQGWQHVLAETDCLKVINVVNGGEECYAAAGAIVDRITSLMAMLNIPKIIYTPIGCPCNCNFCSSRE